MSVSPYKNSTLILNAVLLWFWNETRKKWFKPSQGQFQIYWKSGFDSKEYIPDFVVETEDSIWLVETKAGKDLKDPEVLAKADAAFEWCKHATDYALQHNGKSWRYVMIPHDEVAESKN